MKTILFVSLTLLLALVGVTACAASGPRQPVWVEKMIAGFEVAPVANPPQRILRYRYRDQTVYYIPPTCCDQPSVLYDAKGDAICEPDGGMTGRGDGRCADFRNRRSEESVVWSDPRSR